MCRQQVDFIELQFMLRMSVIIFDCKRRLLWLLVANWLATSRQLVAIVWQLVANQSPDAYLNMKTGIFLQIQDLAVEHFLSTKMIASTKLPLVGTTSILA